MSNTDGKKKFRFRADLSFFSDNIDSAMKELGEYIARDDLDESMDFIGSIHIGLDDGQMLHGGDVIVIGSTGQNIEEGWDDSPDPS